MYKLHHNHQKMMNLFRRRAVTVALRANRQMSGTPAAAVATQQKAEARDKLFNPTEEHKSLREMIRSFVEAEVFAVLQRI